MLYIDNIDNNTVRFGGDIGGGAHPKFIPKTLRARADELGLISIVDVNTNASHLNLCPVTKITLNGTVYTSSWRFVDAFNSMIANNPDTTTTTSTSTTTTTTSGA